MLRLQGLYRLMTVYTVRSGWSRVGTGTYGRPRGSVWGRGGRTIWLAGVAACARAYTGYHIKAYILHRSGGLRGTHSKVWRGVGVGGVL